MVRSFAFGERAVINLFRGAGGLLGSSGGAASGMDALNSRFREAFQDYFWVSQVHSSYEGDVFNFREVGSQRAQVFTNQFDRVQALAVVGYSAGGLSAIRFAKGLDPREVELVVQIESFDPLTGSSREDEILPENVIKGINYYQSSKRFNPFRSGFDPTDLQGAQVVEGSENINAESFFGDRTITHRNIEDKSSVQNQILENIEQYVLQDLRFDRSSLLALNGGSRLSNNILALGPDPSGQDGSALIESLGNIDADFSFQTRFEFRLPSPNSGKLPGFSFWILPSGNYASEATQSSLTVTFEPFSFNALSTESNVVGIFTPDISSIPLAQGPVDLDLDSGQSLTAWVNYDGLTDQLSVFVDDSLVKPAVPVVAFDVALPRLTGPQAQFGFQSTVEGEDRSADLLTWQLTTTREFDLPLARAVTDEKRLPFDYNGDKKSDLAFFRNFLENDISFGQVGVWLLNGIDSPQALSSVDVYPFEGRTGEFFPALPYRNLDFNGDGKTDFLFERALNSEGEGFELGVWLVDGTDPVEQAVIATVPSAWDNPLTYESFAPRLPGAGRGKGPFGDFNGDGKTDILWLKTNPAGDHDLGFWLVDGVAPIAQVNAGNIGSDWLPITLNDFNADGKDDVLFERIRRDGSVEYGLWLMDGVRPTLQTTIDIIPAGEGWSAKDTNDFNRDGRADILFSRKQPTQPGQIEYGLWLMDGANPYEQMAIGARQDTWSLVDHNDFNGDGKADLLFSRPVGNEQAEYSVWLMDGSSVIADSVLDMTPASWAYSGSADINGDGVADLEFVDESTLEVVGWLMEGSLVSARGIIEAYDSIDSPQGWLPPFATPAPAGGLV